MWIRWRVPIWKYFTVWLMSQSDRLEELQPHIRLLHHWRSWSADTDSAHHSHILRSADHLRVRYRAYFQRQIRRHFPWGSIRIIHLRHLHMMRMSVSRLYSIQLRYWVGHCSCFDNSMMSCVMRMWNCETMTKSVIRHLLIVLRHQR